MADLPLLRDPDAVELTGTVERVIFHNEENGYTVLRLLPDKGLTGEAKVTGRARRVPSAAIPCPAWGTWWTRRPGSSSRWPGAG